MNVLAVAAGVVAGVASLFGPYAIRPWLRRRGVMDIPSARSSHRSPAIRGMGLAQLFGMSLALGLVVLLMPLSVSRSFLIVIMVMSVGSAALGWLEDSRGIRVLTRAVAQLSIGLMGSAALVLIAGWNPWWFCLGAIFVAGYINVANFMDGVDGISGLHGLLVGLTFAMVGEIYGHLWLTIAGWVLAMAFFAFLPWNLGRESAFLGDTGSYLLGGSIAGLAVASVAEGVPLLVVLGPLFIYLADTSFTLVKRVLSGEKWHQSHRSHTYHRIEDLGYPHIAAAVVVTVASATTAGLGLLVVDASAIHGVFILSGMIVVAATYLSLPRVLKPLRNSRDGNANRLSSDMGHKDG